MNLNFVNAGIFPGQIIPEAMGGDSITTSKGSGTGSDFFISFKALLSTETGQLLSSPVFSRGKFEGGFQGKKNSSIHSSVLGEILTSGVVDGKGFMASVQDGMVTGNGKNMQESMTSEDDNSTMLPISALPFISSLLGALQIPEQRSDVLINDAKEEGVGIDLNRLIKGLQGLQQEAFFSGSQFKVIPGISESETRWVEQMFTSLGLESGEISYNSLTLDDFVGALERQRVAFAGTPEPETEMTPEAEIGDKTGLKKDPLPGEELSASVFDPLPVGSILTPGRILGHDPSRLVADPESEESEELEINLDRLITSLEQLQQEESGLSPLGIAGFVSFLKDQREFFGMTSGGTTSGQGANADIEPETGVQTGIKTNRYNLFRQIQAFEKQEISHRFLSPGDFAAAMEKQSAYSGTGSFDSFFSELSKKGEAETLLNRLMTGLSLGGEQSEKPGDSFNPREMTVRAGIGTGSVDNPVSFAGIKAIPEPQSAMNFGIQKDADPELVKFMENAAALVKEMKVNADDTRTIGREVNDGAAVKEIPRGVAAIDAFADAGGQSRQMGMEFRNQVLSNQGSPRSVLPSFVATQVGKGLARAVSQGDTELKLQLRPPELGRILMTIDNRGNSIKVSVITENMAAKEILASHANELKITLANSGISIESFDVEMGGDFNQSMADARQHFRGSGAKSGRVRGGGTGPERGEKDPNSDVRGSSGDVRSLHFVA